MFLSAVVGCVVGEYWLIIFSPSLNLIALGKEAITGAYPARYHVPVHIPSSG